MTDTDKEIVLAYAENNMNRSETARQFYMSYSGLLFRLERIQRITGLDPRKFYDLVKLVEMCKGDNE